jgi:hypothetical protein
MKTVKVLPVNHLRIYPEEREHTSKVSGTKSLRVGAIVLDTVVELSKGQKPLVALELTAKQLNNLIGMHALPVGGRSEWLDFARLVQVSKSSCSVTLEEHAKDDTYYDQDGVEQKYTETSTASTCNSIKLPNSVANKLVEKTINKMVAFNGDDDDLRDAFENSEKPALAGVL